MMSPTIPPTLKRISTRIRSGRLRVCLAAGLLAVFGCFCDVADLRADPSDTFLKAYMAVQSGDRLEGEGKLADALQKYRVAAELLDTISREHPDWQPHVLQYRMRKTSEGIARLTDKLGDAAPPEAPTSGALTDSDYPLPSGGLDGAPPSLSVSPDSVSPYDPTLGSSTGDVLDEATREIRNRIRQLEAELSTARRRAAQVEQERTQLARQLEATDTQLQEALRKLDQSRLSQTELKTELEEVKEALKAAITTAPRNEELEAQIDQLAEELEIARAERDMAQDENIDLNRQIARQQAIVARISAERDAILAERDAALAEVERAAASRAESERLLEENAELVARLDEAEARIKELQERPGESEELLALRDQMGDLREQLAMAQEQRETYQSANADLEAELNRVTTELAAARDAGRPTETERSLMAENQVLKQIIEREMQRQARRDQAKSLVLEELARMEVKSDTLIEQIDLLGQPVIELTEQEAALLRSGDVRLADDAAPAASGPPVGSPPSGEAGEAAVSLSIAARKDDGDAAGLPGADGDMPDEASASEPVALEAAAEKEDAVADPVVELERKPSVPAELQSVARDAREYFQRGQYREAEELYKEILLEAPDNVYALSNLGVTQFRSGRLKAAEASFKKAIAIDPEDAFSLSTLGIVYHRQGRYDDAIDVLTKAIAISPGNAVAHNYLGITASQKGWQEAAEKELQTAIAINPNYADAHFNLAVIYAVSQPPAHEMARKHYARATELGAAPDPNLERLIQ